MIRRRQATFARERDAEMAEVQRMEAEAKRKSAEKWVTFDSLTFVSFVAMKRNPHPRDETPCPSLLFAEPAVGVART